MKTVPKSLCCSRCGDLIPAGDLVYSLDRLCAVCSNMRLDAQQIIQSQRQRIKARSTLFHSVPVSQQ